jgi:hypothetical protein
VVPAVGQDHHQRPGQPAASRLGVGHQAQPSEVHFGQLPGRALCHPHCRTLASAEPAVLDREPAQRGVRNAHALPRQQLLSLREPQAPLILRAEAPASR